MLCDIILQKYANECTSFIITRVSLVNELKTQNGDEVVQGPGIPSDFNIAFISKTIKAECAQFDIALFVRDLTPKSHIKQMSQHIVKVLKAITKESPLDTGKWFDKDSESDDCFENEEVQFLRLVQKIRKQGSKQ